MSTPITALYAGLLTIILIYMIARVIRLRRTRLIGLGVGEDSDLQKAVRVHANAAENLPTAMILMLIYEINSGSLLMLHAAGLLLVVGRILHLLGITKSKGATPQRIAAGVFTWTAMGGLAGACIALFLKSAMA